MVRAFTRRSATHSGQRAFRQGRAVWDAVMRDDIGTSASSFAYHMIFAIPPLIILTVTIAALMTRLTSVDVTANLQRQIQDHAPAATRQLLTSVVDQALVRISSGGASIGVVVTAALALWSGSNAISALIEAFNRAYGVEETRKTIRLKATVLGLTLLLTLFINLAFILLVFGQRIGHWIANKAGLGGAFDVTFNLARWPLAIATIGLILAVLYDKGPNVEQSFRWISPGSALATILWLIAIRREGQQVGFWKFLKWGALVMPPALALAILTVLLSSRH